MSWRNIIKGGRGNVIKINYPLLKEATKEVTEPYETFTLSEIIPLVRESYKEKLKADGMHWGNATSHARAKVSLRRISVLTRIINQLGIHKKSSDKRDGEFIFKRVE